MEELSLFPFPANLDLADFSWYSSSLLSSTTIEMPNDLTRFSIFCGTYPSEIDIYISSDSGLAFRGVKGSLSRMNPFLYNLIEICLGVLRDELGDMNYTD